MTAVARAYNTDYKQHIGLIRTFALKAWGRLQAAHVSEDFEDVYQLMCVSYTKALAAYDPTKGTGFTAYLGRAIWNDFNRYADKRIAERMELGLTEISTLEAKGGEDSDEGWFDSVLESDERNPQDELERKQQIIHNLRQLSPTAKFLVAQLVNPSQALEAAFAHYQAEVKATRQRAVNGMSLVFIGEHHGIERNRLRRAIREIKTQYEV